MNRHAPHLGEPDLRLAGFQLWVHGPPVVDPRPYEDWLNVTAHCGAGGASVWTSGEILQLGDVALWLKQTEEMHRTLSGAARLSPLEPWLSVLLTIDGTGKVEMEVEITPDPRNQRHRFTFSLDQSYLPAFLAQGRRLMARIHTEPAPGAWPDPHSNEA